MPPLLLFRFHFRFDVSIFPEQGLSNSEMSFLELAKSKLMWRVLTSF